jgi:hypothetical protein
MFGLGSTARFALETLESLPIMFGLGPDAVSVLPLLGDVF